VETYGPANGMNPFYFRYDGTLGGNIGFGTVVYEDVSFDWRCREQVILGSACASGRAFVRISGFFPLTFQLFDPATKQRSLCFSTGMRIPRPCPKA
jgi:hypothetical protein